MRLADPAARLAITLTPTAYQFPATAADAADRNWLVIDGHVTQRRNIWVFSEPCLTTTEAAGVGEWLGGVGTRTAPGGVTVTYTEPNLAFTLVSYDDTAATIRVHLSLECAPPWQQDAELLSFFLEMTTSYDAVLAAADDWAAELAAFPPRP